MSAPNQREATATLRSLAPRPRCTRATCADCRLRVEKGALRLTAQEVERSRRRMVAAGLVNGSLGLVVFMGTVAGCSGVRVPQSVGFLVVLSLFTLLITLLVTASLKYGGIHQRPMVAHLACPSCGDRWFEARFHPKGHGHLVQRMLEQSRTSAPIPTLFAALCAAIPYAPGCLPDEDVPRLAEDALALLRILPPGSVPPAHARWLAALTAPDPTRRGAELAALAASEEAAPWLRVEALQALLSEAAATDLATAATHARALLELQQHLQGLRGSAESLLVLSEVALAQGDAESARWRLGAAERLLGVGSWPLSPSFVQRHATLVAALRPGSALAQPVPGTLADLLTTALATP